MSLRLFLRDRLRDRLASSAGTSMFATAFTMAVTDAGSFSGGEARQRSSGFITSHVLPSKTTPRLVGIGMPSDGEVDQVGDRILGDTPLDRCFVRRR